jgi:hypothetical protein
VSPARPAASGLRRLHPERTRRALASGWPAAARLARALAARWGAGRSVPHSPLALVLRRTAAAPRRVLQRHWYRERVCRHVLHSLRTHERVLLHAAAPRLRPPPARPGAVHRPAADRPRPLAASPGRTAPRRPAAHPLPHRRRPAVPPAPERVVRTTVHELRRVVRAAPRQAPAQPTPKVVRAAVPVARTASRAEVARPAPGPAPWPDTPMAVPTAGPEAATPLAADLDELTVQVLRRIERRAVAQRERLGRV